jgi:hypothetical protein
MFLVGRLGRLVDWDAARRGTGCQHHENALLNLDRVQPSEGFWGAAGRMSAAATHPRNMYAHRKVLPIKVLPIKVLPINDTEV